MGRIAARLTGRLGWEETARDVAAVYNELPVEDHTAAGIYADIYPLAGAIDQYRSKYGLPHAVSGSMTYYLWGPGYFRIQESSSIPNRLTVQLPCFRKDSQ